VSKLRSSKPKKLMKLVEEITRLLDEKQSRLRRAAREAGEMRSE
jgi:hypothetical protein